MMLLVYALSHLPRPANETIKVNMRIEHHGFTTQKHRQIQMATADDPVLSLILPFVHQGYKTTQSTQNSTTILGAEG